MKYPNGKFVGYDDLCKRMDIHCILTINKQNKKIKKKTNSQQQRNLKATELLLCSDCQLQILVVHSMYK